MNIQTIKYFFVLVISILSFNVIDSRAIGGGRGAGGHHLSGAHGGHAGIGTHHGLGSGGSGVRHGGVHSGRGYGHGYGYGRGYGRWGRGYGYGAGVGTALLVGSATSPVVYNNYYDDSFYDEPLEEAIY